MCLALGMDLIRSVPPRQTALQGEGLSLLPPVPRGQTPFLPTTPEIRNQKRSACGSEWWTTGLNRRTGGSEGKLTMGLTTRNNPMGLTTRNNQYDKTASKSGEHIKEAFEQLSLNIIEEPICFKDDLNTANKDWHYRFHMLTIKSGKENVLENAIIDFKHYFTVPISYLLSHKNDRVLRLDNLFAEQITLKFSTYLSRVAIP